MVDAVVSFFIETVTDQLGQQAQLLYKVREDIAWIKGELQAIRAFLKDADRRRERDAGVEDWIAQLRHEVFDAEDVVDAFMVQMEIENRLRVGCMSQLAYYAFIFKHMKVRRQFAAQIHQIRKKIKAIHDRGKDYGFQASYQQAVSPSDVEPAYRDPQVAPWVEDPDVVGLDDDAEQVQQWLLNDHDTKQRAIISIVGMGGLGKTTLAKKAYKTIKMHFECYSWVYVSQSFDKKDVLKRMLKGFYKSRKETPTNDMETLNEEELRERTFSYLQGKRYALILDDIWDNQVWENVKFALPFEDGGRIILTTRYANLACPVHERCHVHKLQPLSDESAWDLFCRKTFKNECIPGTCPEHLNEVGKTIVRRCRGLPLAIVAISGLLSRKRQTSPEWAEVLENLDWELSHNPDLQGLNQSLLTSYKHLPPHLKCCFLYCGMFPEDHVIKRKKLIHMWVAEGFVEEDPQKTLEEIANGYFLQLIDRNMLQPVVHDRTGEIVSCRVHDLMRDMAIHMFKKEEFALVVTSQITSFGGRHRRVSIQSDEMVIPGSFAELKLRSFLLFNLNELPRSSSWSTLSALKLLRVLDLGGCKINNLPSEVGDMIHLRYLSLKKTKIEYLPASIAGLHNLQTLDVRYSCLTSLPTSIMMLSKLRHLLFVNYQGYLEVPRGTPTFIKIQTLSGAAVDEELSKALGSFTQLRKLRIGRVRREHCPHLCSSISKLKHLLSLKIESHGVNEELQLETLSQGPRNLEKLYLRGMIELPKWVSSLNCLRVIIFEGGQFSDDPLPVLGQLPNLAFVSLFEIRIGKQIGCPRGGFRKLRSMVINSLEELEEWDAIEEDTMQSLQYLHIANCPKLKKLPNGLQRVTTLKKLYLEDMAEGFVESVKTGEDHKKVQHIPIVKQFSRVDGEYLFELLSKDRSQMDADKKSKQHPASKSELDQASSSLLELSQVDGENFLKLRSKDESQSDADKKYTLHPM